MSDERNEGLFQLSHPVTMAFPHLFEARKFKDKRTGKETGEAKFDAMFVFDADHPDLPRIKQMIAAQAKAKFPTEYAAFVAGDKRALQIPIKDGTKQADEAKAKTPPKDNEFLRGKVTLTTRTQFPPFLSALLAGRVVDFKDDARPTAEKYFYPGVLALAEINFQPHNVGSNTPGVTAYLNHVLSINKGDRLAGGSPPTADKFSAYVGAMTAEDPTMGLDSEITF